MPERTRLKCPYCGSEDLQVWEDEIGTLHGEIYVEDGDWQQDNYDHTAGDGEFRSFYCITCGSEFGPNEADLGERSDAAKNLRRFLNGMAEGVLEAADHDDGEVRDDSLRDYATQLSAVAEKVTLEGKILWPALKDRIGTDIDDG